MARKKVSAYTRNRNRIMAYIRRHNKQDENINLQIPTEAQLRKQGVKGSQLTALTNTLKKLTPKKIQELSDLNVNVTTGEILNNEPDFIPPVSISDSTDWYDKVVISTFNQQLSKLEGGPMYRHIKAWANTIMKEKGKKAFADMLSDGFESGITFNYQEVYDKNSATTFVDRMLDFLPDSGVFEKDRYMDRFEYTRVINDASEAEESWELPEEYD